MLRLFWQVLYIGFLISILIVPIVAWRKLLRRTRAGAISRLKSIGLYALAVLAPTLVYLGIFFAMVGIEELTGTAIIAEEIGRTLFLVVGFGLSIWLLVLISYTIAVCWVNRS